MARKIIREAFLKKIENQITEELSPTTMKYYLELQEKGLSQERAMQALAYFYEIYYRSNRQVFHEDKWEQFLLEVPITYHHGDYEFDHLDAKKNIRYLKKRFGILKNKTRQFERELYIIESHLLILNTSYQASSREIQKIIHIVINRLLDIEEGITTDYSDYATEDLLYMADGLEYICNPYVNEAVAKVLKPYVDINNKDNYEYIFKNVFICFLRILDSIEFWDKEFGVDGYFRYIKQFINIDKMSEQGPVIFFDQNTLFKNV